jgi:hypothetical protein
MGPLVRRLPALAQITALVLFLVSTSQAEGRANSKSSDEFICGTPGHVHRRTRPAALTSLQALTTTTVGNTAVLEDDGTVVIQPNRFDLIARSVTFLPIGVRYSVAAGNEPFDEGAGAARDLTLADDDAVEVTLPFSFPFYGRSYNSVYLNSDGNLTFTVRSETSGVSSAGHRESRRS